MLRGVCKRDPLCAEEPTSVLSYLIATFFMPFPHLAFGAEGAEGSEMTHCSAGEGASFPASC